jgi:hypothetical protein
MIQTITIVKKIVYHIFQNNSCFLFYFVLLIKEKEK